MQYARTHRLMNFFMRNTPVTISANITTVTVAIKPIVSKGNSVFSFPFPSKSLLNEVWFCILVDVSNVSETLQSAKHLHFNKLLKHIFFFINKKY